MDPMGHSFGPYEIVFCDYCGGNHSSYSCLSNPESRYFIGYSNWDSSHLNGYTQSWEDHPNLFLNGQDHGTFTSPIPPYHDWINTYSNTFDQSWEEQVDFSGNFQGDDFNNSLSPSMPPLEQVENFESLETMMNDFLQKIQGTVDKITTCVAGISSEHKRQSKIPIPSDIEKSECIGKDKGGDNTLEKSQEIESSKGTLEHLSNPSSLQNIEKVQQNAKIVINPYFKPMQKEHIVADTITSLQQISVENLQVVLKGERDNQSKDLGKFIKSCYVVGKVMNRSPVYAINVLCRDQVVKRVVRKVYKHKWKEKHQAWRQQNARLLKNLPERRTDREQPYVWTAQFRKRYRTKLKTTQVVPRP